MGCTLTVQQEMSLEQSGDFPRQCRVFAVRGALEEMCGHTMEAFAQFDTAEQRVVQDSIAGKVFVVDVYLREAGLITVRKATPLAA